MIFTSAGEACLFKQGAFFSSNFFGTSFVVFDYGVSPKKQTVNNKVNLRRELVGIVYVSQLP